MSDELKFDTSLVDDNIDEDPRLATVLESFKASMQQAFDAMREGKYKTIDEALKSVGITAVKIDTDTGEEIEGASLQDELQEGGFFDDDEPLEATVEFISKDDEGAGHA
jgi:hypothetical protein